jgi:hypothetical protein
MKNQTITLNATQTKLLVQELTNLEKIRKTLLKIIPEFYLTPGSDLWWAKSDLEALEDIKNKRYKTISTHKDLDRFLDNLS